MLSHTYNRLINAPPEAVWEVLMELLEKPQDRVPGVESSRTTERSGDTFTREMVWKGSTVRDKVMIEKNDLRIIQQLLEHPIYEGRIITRVVPTSVQNPMAPVVLQVETELERPSFKVDHTIQTDAEFGADVENLLNQMKKQAEEREHAKEGKGQHRSEGITHRLS